MARASPEDERGRLPPPALRHLEPNVDRSADARVGVTPPNAKCVVSRREVRELPSVRRDPLRRRRLPADELAPVADEGLTLEREQGELERHVPFLRGQA